MVSMPQGQPNVDLLRLMLPSVAGKPAAMMALARQFQTAGDTDSAISLAVAARDLAGAEGEVAVLAAELLGRSVPTWHFALVRDHVRNQAYEDALKRAITPDCLVLEIGTGTGILAMMAARAGARVVTCEAEPSIAAAARDVVAANGLADRVTVVNKHSTALEIPHDLPGPADILVSEIVSNDLLSEAVLPAHGDAARRLLKPGAKVIPRLGKVRVALAHDNALALRQMGEVSGFDLSIFNRVSQPYYDLPVDTPRLTMRGEPADLFAVDFAGAAPLQDQRTNTSLVASGGTANGIVQWLALEMDDTGHYENMPGPGAKSCWGALFWPFPRPIETTPGQRIEIGGYHTQERVRTWLVPS